MDAAIKMAPTNAIFFRIIATTGSIHRVYDTLQLVDCYKMDKLKHVLLLLSHYGHSSQLDS
jgi:hypothetical protein